MRKAYPVSGRGGGEGRTAVGVRTVEAVPATEDSEARLGEVAAADALVHSRLRDPAAEPGGALWWRSIDVSREDKNGERVVVKGSLRVFGAAGGEEEREHDGGCAKRAGEGACRGQ